MAGRDKHRIRSHRSRRNFKTYQAVFHYARSSEEVKQDIRTLADKIKDMLQKIVEAVKSIKKAVKK